MVQVNFHTPDGEKISIDAPEGESVMQVAVQNGIRWIVGECGGSLMCATCHVYVDPDNSQRLGVASDDEDEMLEAAASPRTECSRLSCQIRLGEADQGINIHLPPTQR
ncbi:ferredoxin [Micromonospora sonchi]|uniref:Ferredoxin n=1 Tax=Micromonospora sonchi TaxID=1763543 RepID=A0A917U758_9ACTN|nr:2Fe-2S iron-sulfur cluster-binding protein [Micromonospora sonchi]GGM63901.1 ferredoxin [Micromonospora sonchi]